MFHEIYPVPEANRTAETINPTKAARINAASIEIIIINGTLPIPNHFSLSLTRFFKNVKQFYLK